MGSKVELAVTLLGPLRVEAGATVTLGRKPQALLAYLCRRVDVVVPRDTLAGLLWGDRPDDQARASLRQALSALRKALGPAAEAIVAGSGGVTLRGDRVEIDVRRFEAAAGAEAVDALEAAAALYTGDLMEGAAPTEPEFDRWLTGERAALKALHARVLARLLARHQQDGRHEEAIATASRLLAADPLQENVHRRLMASLSALGRFDAALRQFEDLRAVLQAELGLEPEAATVDLVREIRGRRRGPAVEAPPASRAGPAVAAPARPSIAVLPFRVLSRDEDAAYFGEGVAEDILIELSRTPDLMVVSRQASFRFGAEAADPVEIGAALGVRYLLSGSVRMAGSRLRVAAHLVACETGAEIWADSYDREVEDIFDIQTEIARMVTATVVGRIIDTSARQVLGRRPDDLAAYDLVLRGLPHLHGYSVEAFETARSLFESAAAKDPGYARPLGLTAQAILYKRWYFDVDARMDEVIALAERCVSMDPGDARGHCALGMARMIHREHDRAAYHFGVALARNRNDDHLMIEYARFLMYDDQSEEAIRRVREAMRLNPFHPDWYWNLYGRILHSLGRFNEALPMFERVTTRTFFVEAYCAACLVALDEPERAAVYRNRAYALNPGFDLKRFRTIFPYRNADTLERYMSSLKAAGFD